MSQILITLKTHQVSTTNKKKEPQKVQSLGIFYEEDPTEYAQNVQSLEPIELKATQLSHS